MSEDHQQALNKVQRSVVGEAFHSYYEYIDNAELRDIKLLKKRLYDLNSLR